MYCLYADPIVMWVLVQNMFVQRCTYTYTSYTHTHWLCTYMHTPNRDLLKDWRWSAGFLKYSATLSFSRVLASSRMCCATVASVLVTVLPPASHDWTVGTCKRMSCHHQCTWNCYTCEACQELPIFCDSFFQSKEVIQYAIHNTFFMLAVGGGGGYSFCVRSTTKCCYQTKSFLKSHSWEAFYEAK